MEGWGGVPRARALSLELGGLRDLLELLRLRGRVCRRLLRRLLRGLVRRRRAGRRRVGVVGEVLLAREHGRDVPRVLALRVLALALLVVEAAEQANEEGEDAADDDGHDLARRELLGLLLLAAARFDLGRRRGRRGGSRR